MIVLHAVVAADDAAVPDDRLGRHDAGSVTVLYEETDCAPSRDRASVAAHGQQIVALADELPLLPMRYGTTVRDLDHLRAVAAERADTWSRQLSRLTGRCELVVHVAVTGDVPDPVADSGRAYLRRRMALLERQGRVLDEVADVVDRWADDVRVLPDRERLALLVRRQDTEGVHHLLDAWGRSRDDLVVTVTGPWPPFSFCEDGEPG